MPLTERDLNNQLKFLSSNKSPYTTTGLISVVLRRAYGHMLGGFRFKSCPSRLLRDSLYDAAHTSPI